MNVILSEETHQQLRQRMENGGYATPDDAIRAGLELLKQQESLREFEPGELQALITEGERSILEEGTVDADEAFEERQRRLESMRSNPS